MKKLFLFVALWLHATCFATLFTGTVVCKETGKVIDYANIGIVGKNIGTTSDPDGKFSIALDDSNNNDKIRISSIGFVSLEMKVGEFKNAYKNGSTVSLSQQNNQLQEVVFKHGKYKHKRFGNTANSKAIVAAFDTGYRGYEAGVFMQIRKSPTFIDSVRINLAGCTCDSVFLRMNIYEYTDNDFVNILHEPIYINLPTEEIKEHSVIVDLSKKNIAVTHDFMVSVELVKDMGRQRMFFCASLLSGNGYARKTSQGTWHKTTGVATGTSAYVTY